MHFLWCSGVCKVQSWKLRIHHLPHPTSAALAVKGRQPNLLSWCVARLLVVAGTALSFGPSDCLTLDNMRRTKQPELLHRVLNSVDSAVTFFTAGALWECCVEVEPESDGDGLHCPPQRVRLVPVCKHKHNSSLRGIHRHRFRCSAELTRGPRPGWGGQGEQGVMSSTVRARWSHTNLSCDC